MKDRTTREELQADEVTDKETRELVEMEIREVLSQYQFDGDNIPVSNYHF